MMEQLGLADPIRYTWTLHDRVVGGTCPVGNEYLVTKRNFAIVPSDLDQLQYSSYINQQLYSYYIEENCTAPDCAPLPERSHSRLILPKMPDALPRWLRLNSLAPEASTPA